MNILDSTERVLGRFAIPHLMRYVVAFNVLVYLLILTNPGYGNLLQLDRAAILSGEVWRLVTWIFIPENSPLWILFYLISTWWIGENLEAHWGTYRLNVYYVLGMIGCTVAAFLFGTSGANYLLVLSLLLAIATLAPDMEVLLFVFPVKLKWVALLSLAYPWGLLFLAGPIGTKAMILVCLGNYLLFFGPKMLSLLRGGRRGPALVRRQAPSPTETLHRCTVCGVTEVSDPTADFRVSADGQEYCTRHLPKP